MTLSLPVTHTGADQVEVIAARTRPELQAIFDLRRRVFKFELGMAGSSVEDADDRRSVLALALLRDGEGRRLAVGTGRLTLGAGPGGEGVVTWVATVAGVRRRGVGEAVMRFLLDAADRDGAPEVILAAQAPAIAFYRRLGFVANGRPYLSSNIEHLPMVRPAPAGRFRGPGSGGASSDW